MTWSSRLMHALDGRADVLRTPLGDVQIARAGRGPKVLVSHGGPGGFDLGLAWCWHLVEHCELLAVSRPGYLRTPLASGPAPEEQADLYASALDLLEIDRVAILGFSSGGPSAVHFAARHPDRTVALFLDAAILSRFELPIGRFRRAVLESGPLMWLSHQMASRRPALMARYAIDGVADGLTKSQRRAEVDWITSDPIRLASISEQFGAIAPRAYRRAGYVNDKDNERDLRPLPFGRVAAPTLVAHGVNDAIVPPEHATGAADQIPGAELILVDGGHHLLSLSENYGQVASRQVQLARG